MSFTKSLQSNLERPAGLEVAEKQNNIRRLRELRAEEISRLKQACFEDDVIKAVLEVQPIQYRLEDKNGWLVVNEGEDGFVDARIESAGGEVFDLREVLPKGYRIIGNQLAVFDTQKYGLGFGNISTCLEEHREVSVGEDELKREGWKFVWTLLHEIGHAYFFDEFPEYKPADIHPRAYSELSPNIEETIKEEIRTSTSETNACYIGAEIFRELLERKPFLKAVFKDKGDIDGFYRELLVGKAKTMVRWMSKWNISDSQRERLAQKIFELYNYNPANALRVEGRIYPISG